MFISVYILCTIPVNKEMPTVRSSYFCIKFKLSADLTDIESYNGFWI